MKSKENRISTGRGLAHILEEHSSQFRDIGISGSFLPTFLLDVIAHDRIIGFQGKNESRPIYEYKYAEKHLWLL